MGLGGEGMGRGGYKYSVVFGRYVVGLLRMMGGGLRLALLLLYTHNLLHPPSPRLSSPQLSLRNLITASRASRELGSSTITKNLLHQSLFINYAQTPLALTHMPPRLTLKN